MGRIKKTIGNTSKLEKIIIASIAVIIILLVKSVGSDPHFVEFIPDPIQVNLVQPKDLMIGGKEGEVRVTLVAEYTLEAVVKGKKKYGDYSSQISSYDYILAWGDLNKREVSEFIKYSQRGRWYYYKYYQDLPVNLEYIGTHSANVHIVHQDKEILKDIKSIKKNDHVLLRGYLANVHFKDGPWKSSLTRSDTGNGACEIMYVTSVESLK